MILPALLIFTISASANYELNINKGIALYLEEDYLEAINSLKLAVEENPESPVANQLLGLSYFQLGNYSESITYLEKAKNLDVHL